MTRLWVAAVVALAILGTTQPSFAEKRIALIIGNGAYPNLGTLKNPPNDAKLMARTLRSLGFEVIERIDADQKGMKKAIKAFGNKLETAGREAVGLFYYAGHGVQVRGQNYMIPVNVDIQDEADVDIEAVSANAVLDNIAFAGNDLNIVILDACRNNPFKRSFRAASRGLARMDASKGTLIAYATSPGDVAADGKGDNSPYTEALARAMLTPGLNVERVFKEVRNKVIEATDSLQVPWEASSLTGGDFYFNTEGATPAAAPPQLAALPPADQAVSAESTARLQKEVAVWNAIQGSSNPVDFQDYINEYGENGTFSKMARNKIRRLKSGEDQKERSVTGKSDQQLAGEALIRGRKMIEELTANAENLMDSERLSVPERVAKFRGLLGTIVDFKPMARFTLGAYYDKATPGQWDRFLATYKEMFLSGYEFTQADNWTGDFKVKNIREYGRDTLVTVTFPRQGQAPFQVGFRIRRRPESFFGFKIIDAVTNGLSLLVTQRGEFRPTLDKDGIDGLVAALEKRFGKAVTAVAIPD